MMHFSALILVVCAALVTADSSKDLFSSWFNDQREEIVGELKTLQVQGKLPTYLSGSLYRVGPSIARPGDRNYTNFLDAFGRISQWKIDGSSNSVHFNSAIIKSRVLNESMKGNEYSPELRFDITRHITMEKTEPAESFGMIDTSNMDNTDVNVYKWRQGPNANKIISMTDFVAMNQIDASSLTPLGSLHGKDDDTPDGETFPKHPLWSGSHPGEWKNPVDGKTYLVNWIGTKSVTGTTIYAYAMGEDNVRHSLGHTDIGYLPYSIHSVSVAGNFLSIIVSPVKLEFLETGTNDCLSCSIKDNLQKESGKILVFDLLSGWKNVDTKDGTNTKPAAIIELDPKKHTPTFVFHHVNGRSYEEDGHSRLSLDVCAYNSMDGVLGKHVLGDISEAADPEIRNNIPSGCTAIRRLELDVTASELLSMQDLPIRDADGFLYQTELASVSPKYWGSQACFVYSMVYHAHGSSRYEDMAVVKTDLCAAARADFTTVAGMYHEENVYVGEPLFVANPAGTEEDDGVVLVVSRAAEADETRLLVLDAKSMQPVATITGPFPLMFEFHGQFFEQ
eukprot:GSChrysophyteH1.ASY1.ANO1.1879.1 assembled CDS